MSGNNRFIVCLMGPTACGKTALGIRLAQELNTEIISVDSALIYRGMDIGTAKPSMEERCGIVHHLIDIRDPSEVYSAANFRDDALRLIEDIQGRGKIPLLVGGTMLYFNALLSGISDLPQSDPVIRQKLQEKIKQEGIENLHGWLRQMDPVSAERIKPFDEQRIMRALEVKLISGKTITELTEKSGCHPFSQPSVQLALMPDDREELRRKIGMRFDRMLEDGFIGECRKLFSRTDLNHDFPSMRAVGYRQCMLYLEGKTDLDEMIFRAKVATCQLAKRQITWLRGWKYPLDRLIPGCESNFEYAMNRINRQRFGASCVSDSSN